MEPTPKVGPHSDQALSDPTNPPASNCTSPSTTSMHRLPKKRVQKNAKTNSRTKRSVSSEGCAHTNV